MPVDYSKVPSPCYVIDEDRFRKNLSLIKYISDESSMAVTFHKKLKELLTPAKVIRYYQAENQYKIQLLNELQENRQHRGIKAPDL